MMFPTTEAGFPRFPDFLKDVSQQNPITKPVRKVVFDTARAGQPRVPPAHTINGKKFEEDQDPIYVEEGTAEEWNLINTTLGPPIDHPFHIHINPFQVVEVFDPRAENLTNPNAANYINPVTATPEDLYNLKAKTLPQPTSPYIWWDVIAIPAALSVPDPRDPRDSTKNITVPGHVRIQTQFLDFTGTYVIHCHILAHEDRGMMQLVTCRPKGDTSPVSKAAIHHH
jgi:FtsP/CotA-like multicopper oxidase with cupredoxin domain